MLRAFLLLLSCDTSFESLRACFLDGPLKFEAFRRLHKRAIVAFVPSLVAAALVERLVHSLRALQGLGAPYLLDLIINLLRSDLTLTDESLI